MLIKEGRVWGMSKIDTALQDSGEDVNVYLMLEDRIYENDDLDYATIAGDEMVFVGTWADIFGGTGTDGSSDDFTGHITKYQAQQQEYVNSSGETKTVRAWAVMSDGEEKLLLTQLFNPPTVVLDGQSMFWTPAIRCV